MLKVNLAELLKERSMTQAELAAKTEIRPSTICDIFHENCTFLKLENIEKICTALNCDPGDIITK